MMSDTATGDGIEGVFEFNKLPSIQRQAQAFADLHRFLVDLGLCREDQEPYQVVDMAKNLVFNSSIQQQAAALASMPSKESIAAMFGSPTDMLLGNSIGSEANADKDVNVEGDKDSE